MLNWNTSDDKKLLLKLGVANVILFFIVYIPTNNFSHETYYRLYFSWELSIPFLKWMIIPYHAFNLLFLVPFFILRKKSIEVLSLSFATCTVIAGISFILFPSQIGFQRVIPDGFTAPLYKYLFMFDNTTNLIPSLHVTYVTLFFISCINYLKEKRTKILFTIVSLLIITSALFTHQHHFIDIISGALLACIVFWFIQKYVYTNIRETP